MPMTTVSPTKPVVFEAYVDPNVPPLPPHITLEQARHFAQSMMKGDEHTGGILKQSLKGMVEQFKHRKE